MSRKGSSAPPLRLSSFPILMGAPIFVPKTPHPSREAIDRLHATYLEKLVQLFEEHKDCSLSPFLLDSVSSWSQGCWCLHPPLLLGRMLALRKHLEALSVFQWVLTFLFFGLFFTVLLTYLLFTSCWFIPVLYGLWWIADWDTPERGGRRSGWMRRWRIWHLHRDYFPIKLVKTAELPPTKNYVLGSHPHGIICAGAFSAFCTEATGFSRTFPGLKPSLALLAGLFHLPVYREYMMSSGMIPVSKRALDFMLQGGPGNAVVIVVGGASESLDCTPGEQRVHLRGRRGFVRLALQHGADLVPVYSFGENSIFWQVRFPEGSWARRVQLRFKQLTGFAPCLFGGRDLFCSRFWGILPLAVPLTVVVGKPIPVPRRPSPTEEEVEHFHRLYVQALGELFDAHKASCGLSPSEQLVVA